MTSAIKVNQIWWVYSFYISESFAPIFAEIRKLAETDDDPDFIEYCISIERMDSHKKSQRKRSKTALYLSWILTKHLLEMHEKNGQGFI